MRVPGGVTADDRADRVMAFPSRPMIGSGSAWRHAIEACPLRPSAVIVQVTDERRDDTPIERLSDLRQQGIDGAIDAERLTIGPPADHADEGVGDRDDPCG